LDPKFSNFENKRKKRKTEVWIGPQIPYPKACPNLGNLPMLLELRKSKGAWTHVVMAQWSSKLLLPPFFLLLL